MGLFELLSSITFDVSLSRRELGKSFALATGVFVGSQLIPDQVYADDDVSDKARVFQEILNPHLMSTSNPNGIQEVVYNSRTSKTNFRELVYQEHLPVTEKKPVLMMVYTSDRYDDFERREIEIFTALQRELGDRVRFVLYDATIEPEFRVTRKEGNKEYVQFGEELDREEILSIPSLILYGLFDLVKGETPDSNDGNIKRLDIMKGAPDEDRGIPKRIRNCRDWWLKLRALGEPNPDGDGKLYWFDNQYKLKMVPVTQYSG